MKLADLASNNKPPKPSEGKKFEAKMKVKTWPALHMLSVDFPKSFVDELNTFIDDVVIPDDKDYGHSLVGQIRQDEKSKQLLGDIKKPITTSKGSKLQDYEYKRNGTQNFSPYEG